MRSETSIVTEPVSYPIRSRRSQLQALTSRLRNHELALGIALALFVAILGILLTAQGWRSRTPAHDLVPHIINARNLVTKGMIPVHGDTGSYGSYKPPGTAWLMVPSTLLFSDPRLSEYTGAALLHLATLAGIFLLAYRFLGFWPACLAVLIYGLSSTGLSLAASLWPNGRPDFFIWTVYFASLWAIRKEARYLAVAVAIWGVGMNVDMALLPAIFILPALWWVYRPPIHLKPLIVAVVLIMVVWSSYLQFEVGRDFADMRSQVLLQNIFPADFRKTWCDPNIPLRELGSASIPAPLGSSQPQEYHGPNLVSAAILLTNEISGKLLYNFIDAAPFPGISIAFLLMVVSSFILLNVTGHTHGSVGISQRKRFWSDRTTLVALAIILIGVLTNEYVIAHILGIKGGLELSTIIKLRTLEKLLILGGACILAVKWLAAFADWLLKRAGIKMLSKEHADQVKALLLCLAIPWFILLLVAEPGKPERFWWLWPLESIYLAAFILWILPRLRVPRALIWLAAMSVAALVALNPFSLSRINSWRETGWAGKDAPAVQVVNYLTGQLDAEGKKQAAIGYHFFIYQFMAAYNITNPEYKVGSDFDLMLKYSGGITNTNQCAEGLSPLDEYRIVQTKPEDGIGTPRQYFDFPLGSGFQLLRQFGPYEVFKRQTNHG